MNNIIVLRFYKMSIKIDVPVRSNNLVKIDRSIVASLIFLVINIYRSISGHYIHWSISIILVSICMWFIFDMILEVSVSRNLMRDECNITCINSYKPMAILFIVILSLFFVVSRW